VRAARCRSRTSARIVAQRCHDTARAVAAGPEPTTTTPSASTSKRMYPTEWDGGPAKAAVRVVATCTDATNVPNPVRRTFQQHLKEENNHES
jgi:hypothetical protein